MIFLAIQTIVLAVVVVAAFVAGFATAAHRLPYRERWQGALALAENQNGTILEMGEQARALAEDYTNLTAMSLKSKNDAVRINAELRAQLEVARADADAVQLALSDRPRIESKMLAERLERQRLEQAINQALKRPNDEAANRLRDILKGDA